MSEIIRDKYPIIIVNAERTSRKTFMTFPNIEDVIIKANNFGCRGSIILHDEDGSEICDDEILEYLLIGKAIFMVCNKNNDWTPHNVARISVTKQKESVPQIQIRKVIPNHCSGVISPNSSIIKQIDLPETVPFPTSLTETAKDIVRNLTYPDFANFSLPWDKVSPFIMHLLETEQPLHRNINALANLFIDELMLIKPVLPIPVMRNVAEQTILRYPASFAIDKNLSEATDMFLSILKYRYYSLKRGKMMSKKSQIKSVNKDSNQINVLPELDINEVKLEFDSLSSDEF